MSTIVVDVRRVAATLEQCKRSAELVALVAPITKNFAQAAVHLRPEVIKAIEDYVRRPGTNIMDYESFLSAKGNYRASPPQSRRSSKSSRYSGASLQSTTPRAGIGHQSHDIVWKIVHLLEKEIEENDSAAPFLDSCKPQISKEVNDFLNCLQKFINISLKRLDTPIVEHRKREDFLKEVFIRHKQNVATEKILREKHNRAMNDLKQKLNIKEDVIRGIEMQIEQTKDKFDDEVRQICTEAEKTIVTDWKNSEFRQEGFSSELLARQQHYANTVQTNRIKELEMRAKRYKMESDVEGWIQKYDQDMQQRQEELETIQAEYDFEKTQLNELQGRFDEMEKQYEVAMAEKAEEEERKRQEKLLAIRKIQAVRIIQNAWREYRKRKKDRKKRKGKKGSKDKIKKGPKKKK